MNSRPTRILAVASGGGHWIQMKRLRPAFEGHQVTFATVESDRQIEQDGERLYRIPDANQNTPVRMLRLAFRMAWIVLRTRPDVVISTGAAPGYIAICWGRLIGARTIFIDSIANVEKLSMSARLASRCAHVTLTQWSELAGEQGPQFWGAVV